MLAMLPLCKPLGLPRHICRTTSYKLFIYYTSKWFKMCRICTVYIYIYLHIYIYFNWFVYYILYCLLMFINRFIHSLSCIYHIYIYVILCEDIVRAVWKTTISCYSMARDPKHTPFPANCCAKLYRSKMAFLDLGFSLSIQSGTSQPDCRMTPTMPRGASEGAPKKTRLTFES